MKPVLRTLARSALVGCLSALALTAHANDDYPNKPITIVTPTAAGGGTISWHA